MNKYIKLKKDSEIGKKLTELFSVIPEAKRQALAICNKYGFETGAEGCWTYGGGLSAFCRPKQEIDQALFKKDKDDFYTPRLTSRKGKEIQAEIKSVPRVERSEVNELFGLEVFAGLGIVLNNPEYFGIMFNVGRYNPTIPDYAIEITASEYESLNIKK